MRLGRGCVSGPADKEDIKARLAIFAYPQSAYLHAYLYGSEAEKQVATTNYFNALPNPFIWRGGRRRISTNTIS